MLCLSVFDLPTKSSSGFLYRYALPRMNPPPLVGPFARNPFFNSFINNEGLLVGTGHGSSREYSGQWESPLLVLGQYDNRQTKDKIIKLVSCDCGQELASDLVNYGKARACLAYSDDLIWLASGFYYFNPWDCPEAKPVMLSIMNGIDCLLDGATVKESLTVEKQGYFKAMEDASSELEFSILKWDYDHAVLFGGENARLDTVRPNIRFPFPPPPMLF